jgi:hypothetical protein
VLLSLCVCALLLRCVLPPTLTVRRGAIVLRRTTPAFSPLPVSSSRPSRYAKPTVSLCASPIPAVRSTARSFVFCLLRLKSSPYDSIGLFALPALFVLIQ